MFKRLLIGLFFSLITFSVAAQPHYNYVKSVQVNGLEMKNPQNFTAIQAAFGHPLNPTKLLSNNECTGNPEALLTYKNRSITMEFFPEENPKGIALANPNSKASIWLEWQTTSNMMDKIKLDNQIINANMHFDEFKQLFPLSAKMGVVDKSKKGVITYSILVGGDPKDEELPYRSHMNLNFKNKQLMMLSLQQGLAC